MHPGDAAYRPMAITYQDAEESYRQHRVKSKLSKQLPEERDRKGWDNFYTADGGDPPSTPLLLVTSRRDFGVGFHSILSTHSHYIMILSQLSQEESL